MTVAEARAAVFKRWIQLWPGLSGNTPYSTENNVAPEDPTHASITFDAVSSELRTLGERSRRQTEHRYLINVRLVGPINAGTAVLDALAEHVKTIFGNRRFASRNNDSGLETEPTVIRPERRETDAGHVRTLRCVTPASFIEVRGA
jgi:hypothetical protein